MEKGNFSTPTRTVDLSGKGTLDVLKLGDMTVSRATFLPGWRWSVDVKPIVGGDSCQTLHRGFVVSGRLQVRMNDGSELEYGAGDVWIVPPGHDAWVLGDDTFEVLEFTLPPAS